MDVSGSIPRSWNYRHLQAIWYTCWETNSGFCKEHHMFLMADPHQSKESSLEFYFFSPGTVIYSAIYSGNWLHINLSSSQLCTSEGEQLI